MTVIDRVKTINCYVKKMSRMSTIILAVLGILGFLGTGISWVYSQEVDTARMVEVIKTVDNLARTDSTLNRQIAELEMWRWKKDFRDSVMLDGIEKIKHAVGIREVVTDKRNKPISAKR